MKKREKLKMKEDMMMQNKPQMPQKLKAFKFEGFTVAP